MPQIDGALVSPNAGGATNWLSPSFSPKTGLFYVNATRAYSVFYLYDPSDNRPGGAGPTAAAGPNRCCRRSTTRPGKIRWSHPWDSGGRTGVLSTAGNVIFTGGSAGFTALDATTGELLWASRLANAVSNGPITYELDGLQYVVVAAGNSLAAFVLNK